MPTQSNKEYRKRQQEILNVLLDDYEVTEATLKGQPIVTLKRLSDGFVYKPSPCSPHGSKRFLDTGYFSIKLHGVRGTLSVHRLVWMLTHKKIIPQHMEIDHLDCYIDPVTGKDNHPELLGLRPREQNRGVNRKKPVSVAERRGDVVSMFANLSHRYNCQRSWTPKASVKVNGKQHSFTGGSWLYEADAFRELCNLWSDIDSHLRGVCWREYRNYQDIEKMFVVNRFTGRLVEHNGDYYILRNPAHCSYAEWLNGSLSETVEPSRRGRKRSTSVFDLPKDCLKMDI